MTMPDNGSANNSSSDASDSTTGNGVGAPPPHNELPRWATKQQSSAPFSDQRMAAYIGPRWESTYRAKLARFIEDPAFTPTWNWAAAIGSPFWFLYRKLYLSFLAFLILPNMVFGFVMGDQDPSVLKNPESPEAMTFVMMWVAVAVSAGIAAGGTANWFLFRRARAASMVVTMQQVPEDVAVSRLARLGGVSIRPVVLFLIFTLAFSLVTASAGSK
ncbi:MAG: DUF2628 domain-containing protein [Gemmatimonadaceae bacterium]